MSRAPESAWDELIAVALVGTERRRDLPPAVRAATGLPDPEAVEDGKAVEPVEPVEAQVLAAATLLGGGRRAGWVPPAPPAGVLGGAAGGAAPPPEEDRPVAPATAVQVLELLLSGAVSVPGGPDGLVGEWLARCARRSLRVPPPLLAPVLDRASGNPALRDAAAGAAGERGRWLAGLNPAWSWATVHEVTAATTTELGPTPAPAAARPTESGPAYAAAPPAEAADAVEPEHAPAASAEPAIPGTERPVGAGPGPASDGSPAGPSADTGAGGGLDRWREEQHAWDTGVRSVRLEVLRRVRAADPAAGRGLVESTWVSEAAADRATFVQVLHDAGLSDGDEPFLEAALDDRAAVVRAAAAAALDALPASRRAARMAARALPLVRVEGRLRARLVVDLPEAPDAATRRDGVSDHGSRAVGRYGWGRRAWWLVQLVTAAPLGAWADHLGLPPRALVELPGVPDELLVGWAQAAIRQRDPAWVEALLPRRLDQPRLLAVLDPPAAERALTPLLTDTRVDARRLVGLLDACPRPWSPALSSLVVARLRAAGDRPGPLLQAAPTLAAALDPAVAPEVEAWLNGLGDNATGRRDGRRLHHALTLRATIAEELP